MADCVSQKQEVKDTRIYKRFSWNCGKRTKQQQIGLSSKNSTSSASSFGSYDPASRNSSNSSCDFGGPAENELPTQSKNIKLIKRIITPCIYANINEYIVE